jgi:hypothetical protein
MKKQFLSEQHSNQHFTQFVVRGTGILKRRYFLVSSIAVACVGFGFRKTDASVLIESNSQDEDKLKFDIAIKIDLSPPNLYRLGFSYNFSSSQSIICNQLGLLPSRGYIDFVTSERRLTIQDTITLKVLYDNDIEQIIENKKKQLEILDARNYLLKSSLLVTLGQNFYADQVMSKYQESLNDPITMSSIDLIKARSALQQGTPEKALSQISLMPDLYANQILASRHAHSRMLILALRAEQAILASKVALALGQTSRSKSSLDQYPPELADDSSIYFQQSRMSSFLKKAHSEVLYANQSLGEVCDFELLESELVSPIPYRTGSTYDLLNFILIIQSLCQAMFKGHPMWRGTKDGEHYLDSPYRLFSNYEEGILGRFAFRVAYPIVNGKIAEIKYKLSYALEEKPLVDAEWKAANSEAVKSRGRKIAYSVYSAFQKMFS